MKRLLWVVPLGVLLLIPTAMPGERSGVLDLPESHEPSAGLDLEAKTISLASHGGYAKVLVEITLHPVWDLRSARIHGSVATRTRPRRVFETRDVIESLRGRTTRKIQYELELERGLEHHVYFTAHTETAAGALHETTTYLRVNLDPALQPEERGEVLQFRARMAGEEGRKLAP